MLRHAHYTTSIQTHSRWMTFSTFIAYIRCLPNPIHIFTFHVGWTRTHPACERFIYFPAKACKKLSTKKTTPSHSKTATWMSGTRVRRPTSSLLWTTVWWMKSQDLIYSLSMPIYGNVQRTRERVQHPYDFKQHTHTWFLFEFAFVLNDKHTIRRNRTVWRPAGIHALPLLFGIIIVIISLN